MTNDVAPNETPVEAEQPFGECSHCGDLFYDEGEGRWHADANCVGGDERFDSRNQWDTWEEWRGER